MNTHVATNAHRNARGGANAWSPSPARGLSSNARDDRLSPLDGEGGTGARSPGLQSGPRGSHLPSMQPRALTPLAESGTVEQGSTTPYDVKDWPILQKEVDGQTREPSPVYEVEMAEIEWGFNAQSAQARWAEEARTRRERTERILRLPLTDATTLLDAIVCATVASSGIEATEEDGASAKALFAWALRAHAQIAHNSVQNTARSGSRRGARLSPQIVQSLWAASNNINCLLDTVDSLDSALAVEVAEHA